jgi:predicted nucleic acid-binding protein
LSYLLDTNVISELRKGDRADANVREWFGGLDDEEIYLSVLTIGEIRRGVEGGRGGGTKNPPPQPSWGGWGGGAKPDRLN